MKTLLLTAYDRAMAPIGELTSPRMLGYANRHGFDFQVVRNIPDGHHYWQKIYSTRDALKNGFDRVIWLDADQCITNPEWVPEWFTGFQASFDWGNDVRDESQFSACGYVVGKDMLQLFCDIVGMYETFNDKDFPEQSAMRHLYRDGGSYRFRMRTHPRRVFNAVPVEICAEAPEPWQPGDFCCHLTHVPVEERVRVFHQLFG